MKKTSIGNKYNDPFPTRLRQLIEETGVMQYDLAEKIGITRQAISQYCNGLTLPNADKIVEMAKFFDVSTDYLLGVSTCRKADTELKAICDYTGLSEESINLLHIFSKKKRLEFEGFFVTPYLSNMPRYRAADFFSASSFFNNFIIFASKHGIGTGLNILKNADDFLYALLQEKTIDDGYSKQHCQDERFAALFKIQKDFCFFIEDYFEHRANLYFEKFQRIKDEQDIDDIDINEVIMDGEHTGKTE